MNFFKKKEKKNLKIGIFRRLIMMSFITTALPVLVVGLLVIFSYQQVITDFLGKQDEEFLKRAGDDLFLVLQNVGIQAILTLVIVIILSLFGAIIMARNLVRPLKKLLLAVKRVSKGDFNFKVDVSSEDEIGELAGELNEMIKRLKNQSDLEDYKNVLEIRVRAKTRELKELNEGLEDKIEERTRELRKKIEELEKFRSVTVGRELKMVDLKKKNEELQKKIEKKES